MISRINLGRLIQIFAEEEKLERGGQEVEIFQLRVMLLFLYLTTLMVWLVPTQPNITMRWLTHRNRPCYFFYIEIELKKIPPQQNIIYYTERWCPWLATEWEANTFFMMSNYYVIM